MTPPKSPMEAAREQIAQALCRGMEQNGGMCWDGLNKFNRGLYYDQADAILPILTTYAEARVVEEREAEEREACAKTALQVGNNRLTPANDIAKAIRARGEGGM